jgi:hypothetical protein
MTQSPSTQQEMPPLRIATDWEGEPEESDEMRPQWFALDAIPYASMWSDDAIWLPRVLAGETITADFVFDENQGVQEYKIESIADGENVVI